MKNTLLIVFTFLCSLSFNSATSHAALETKIVTSEKHGITAWLIEDHTMPLIAIKFAFRNAGSAQDTPETQGLARIMSNTMDEGADTLDAKTFQETLSDQSITLSFSASRDNFSGTLKTLTRTKDTAFNLLRLALTHPRFDQEPVTRMIKANQSRIKNAMSKPGWISARLLNDAAFGQHPYALNSGGTLSTLDAITPDMLRAYHAQALARDNLIIGVTGDISEETLSQALDSIFGGLPAHHALPDIPDLSLSHTNQTWLYPLDIPQTTIQMVQKGPTIHDPDYHYAEIMNFVLGASGFGSRLTESIREERGLTYGIYTYFNHYDHINLLRLSTSTKNQSVQDVLTLIQQEWQNMLARPISQGELNDAKNYLIGELPLTLTSTDKIAEMLLYLQENNLPVNYLTQREHIIKNATIGDITRTTQQWLEKPDILTVLVGQPDNIKPNREIHDLPNVE